MNRAAVLEVLIGDLRSAIRVAKDRARATARSATHAESRAENDKDTRALEETYLAAGQAQRVADLELDLVEMRALPTTFSSGEVAVGALVRLDGEDHARTVLIARRAGGRAASLGDEEIQIVTPGSPLGRALIGCEEGDEVVLGLKRGRRTYDVVEIG